MVSTTLQWIKPRDHDFSSCDFWIHLKDFPLDLISQETFKAVSNQIRLVQQIEINKGKSILVNIMKVNWNIGEALFKLVTLHQNREIHVPLQYERIPSFCYFCGRMGHNIKDYDTLKNYRSLVTWKTDYFPDLQKFLGTRIILVQAPLL